MIKSNIRMPVLLTVLTSLTALTACAPNNNDNNDNADSTGDQSLFSQTSNVEYQAHPALVLPSTAYNYANQYIPAAYYENIGGNDDNLTTQDYFNDPINNAITDEGATLGRVLFYDTKLSQNGAVSCASCHVQSLGFSDDKVLSEGFDGEDTRRHSMGLANAGYHLSGKYFWDERAATLEEQVLLPIQDSVEMGMSLSELESAVANQDYYPQLFAHAFGDANVTSSRISQALAQFVRSMISVNSRYDSGRAAARGTQDDFANFTAQENLGKDLFFRRGNGGIIPCAACHTGEAFMNDDRGPTANGIDAASGADLGAYEGLANTRLIGTFKVPSLKNIEVTAPYMHDGRFTSLEDVVEHYSSGIQNHENLDRGLTDNGEARSYNFSASEKLALVAFLKTLTDDSLNTDERWSDPFVQ